MYNTLPHIDIIWITISEPRIAGVCSLAYLSNKLVGLNGVLLGDKIAVRDVTGKYQLKYNRLHKTRLSDESDPHERRRGMVMKPWTTQPWYVTWVSQDGSFGITQTPNEEFEVFDILVRADHVQPLT